MSVFLVNVETGPISQDRSLMGLAASRLPLAQDQFMANVARTARDIAQILAQIAIYPISPPCGKVLRIPADRAARCRTAVSRLLQAPSHRRGSHAALISRFMKTGM